MHESSKPVRKCHSCLLNEGDHCWGYRSPRGQWQARRRCPGFENPDAYVQFREWQKQAHVKTIKEIRRETLRGETPRPVYHLEQPVATG